MPQNPHDKLFKSTFSKIENARGFLKSVLPHEISTRVSWDTLKLKSGSFVSEQFREVFSDLLFEAHIAEAPPSLDRSQVGLRLDSAHIDRRRNAKLVPRGGRKDAPARSVQSVSCLLYILAEHKSEQDPWVMLQLLQYQVAIWNRWREEHPNVKRLPPIIPLIVYHGRAEWKVSRQFSDLFPVNNPLEKELQRYLPTFECVVQDLTQKEVTELKQWSELSEFARLVLFLLKSVRDSKNILEDLEAWKEIMRKIERLPHARSRFSMMFSYMFEARKINTQEEKMLLDFVNTQVGKQAKEGLMTGADRLRAEGKAEGEARGKAKTVLKLLQLKFGELSETDIQQVDTASTEKLDRMTELVLTDATLKQILDA